MSSPLAFQAAIQVAKENARLKRRVAVPTAAMLPPPPPPSPPPPAVPHAPLVKTEPVSGVEHDVDKYNADDKSSKRSGTLREDESKAVLKSNSASTSDDAKPQQGYAGLKSASKRKRDGDGESPLDKNVPSKKQNNSAKGLKQEMAPVDLRTPTSNKDSRGNLAALRYIRDLIQICGRAVASKDEESIINSFNNLLTRIHQMEFYGFMTSHLVTSSRVLDSLTQIINNNDGITYPWYIRSDANALYERWLNGLNVSTDYFDVHLLRGIKSQKVEPNAGESRRGGSGKGHGTYHRLDVDYPLKVSCNVIGHNGLRNGQWWPLQICALRDGAHGEIEAGIHGRPGEGAFSVVMSGGGYADIDEGNQIYYSGTASNTSYPSAGTTRLLESHKSGKPIRVLRSSAMPKANRYRPQKGIRYDGLYKVEDFQIKNPQTAMHQFRLVRLPNQYFIRYQGPECRPTAEELDEYSKLQNLMTGKK